ncbi:cbb3-type cytochrome oxidase subunit 3 [Halofilum ochraceum]|uniref:cbb3-type cytochrome oxidase subunit 3 n=1 Tax=Halofilum ochraceum TaxID=1611323 RepID=UPI000829F6DA|nr:cbb3-type cytochrome c oxidase subunit 3 [Halofilum ochraceum]
MSDIWGHVIGVVIILLIVAFVGVWIWAWLPRHHRVFSRMARVPLENDTAPGERRGDEQRTNNHGEEQR